MNLIAEIKEVMDFVILILQLPMQVSSLLKQDRFTSI
jgi:hypothetical protein